MSKRAVACSFGSADDVCGHLHAHGVHCSYSAGEVSVSTTSGR